MKLLLLFLAAASAVTVYRNEDSMAVESQGKPMHRGILPHGEKPISHVHEHEEKLEKHRRIPYRYAKSEQHDHQQPSSISKQQAAHGKFVPRQGRQQDQQVQQQQLLAHSESPYFFENVENVEENGKQLGYTSYVEHEGVDPSDASNVDLKKTAPKSSVQVQFYHPPKEHQKQLVNEGQQVKQKRPTKIFAPSGNFKKFPKPSYPAYEKPEHFPNFKQEFQQLGHSEPLDNGIKNFHELGLSAHLLDSSPTIRPTPEHPVWEFPEQETRQDLTKSPRGPSLNAQRQPYSFREEPQVGPTEHSGVETISVSVSPNWQTLPGGFEIASSEETTEVRRPKEISLFAPHHEEAAYKAQRFDHEKALRSSVPFGVNNIMTSFAGKPVFPTEEPETHFDSSFFHTQSQVENKSPLKFSTSERVKIPRGKGQLGGYPTPVFTQEEFEKYFGREESVEKPRQTRVVRQKQKESVKDFSGYEGVKGLREFYENKQKHSPHEGKVKSFEGKHRIPMREFEGKLKNSEGNPGKYSKKQVPAKFPSNGKITPAYLRHGPNFGKLSAENFPSFGFPARQNISIIPERMGKVFSENEQGHPQQFSVSASYKIDRQNAQGS